VIVVASALALIPGDVRTMGSDAPAASPDLEDTAAELETVPG
jgi:hypothetical protein